MAGARTSKSHRNKHKIVSLDFPTVCPEAYPGNTDRRRISILLLDHQTIWLSIDDVDWAVKYLYAQFQLMGVPVVEPAAPGPQHAPVAEPVAAGASVAATET